MIEQISDEVTFDRALILCSDFQSFHIYLRHYANDPDVEICGFVYCVKGKPVPCDLVGEEERIPVFGLPDMQRAIIELHITKCFVHLHNIPMPQVQAVVNRVVATGKCKVQFLSPYVFGCKSFKPAIAITSIAPQVGKSQLARYICEVLAKKGKKVAIILPMSEIPNVRVIEPDQGIHLYCRNVDDPIIDELPEETATLCKGYMRSGAYRVYITTNTRKAIITAEQHSDVILYDAEGCGHAFILSQPGHPVTNFCVVTKNSISGVRDVSLWPGVVNALLSNSIAVFTPENAPLTDLDKTKLKDVLSHRSEKRDTKFYFVLSKLMTSPIPRLLSIGSSEEIMRHIEYQRMSGVEAVDIHLPRDFPNDDSDPSKLLISGEITDCDGCILEWMKKAFFSNNKPPLKSHFESQVDIFEQFDRVSVHELYNPAKDQRNRASIVRLFLQSHIPPCFRITGGVIVDNLGNSTPKLDVVIVNDDCPRLTIDSSGQITAPIIADSVLGVIDVKSQLTEETLKKSLKQLRPIKALMPSHATLKSVDGSIVQDPLHGKVVTGIIAFKASDDLKQKIPIILKRYPNIADFIVVPNGFSFFSTTTLKVCGMKLAQSQEGSDYVLCETKGMGLALIFGILNALAATRQFSGSNFIRYLGGNWGGPEEDNARVRETIESSLGRIRKHLPEELTQEQRNQFFHAESQLKSVLAGSFQSSSPEIPPNRQSR